MDRRPQTADGCRGQLGRTAERSRDGESIYIWREKLN